MTVKQKQWQLYYLGYLGEDIAAIDGRWGPQSAAATRGLQEDSGIKVDGIFGISTEAKSREIVEAIQEVITAYGSAPLTIDGLAGTATMSATIRYQSANGLTPDGIADRTTREHIGLSAAPAPEEEAQKATGLFWDDIPNFTRQEFGCQCGGRYCNGFPSEPKEAMVRIAQAARDHFGRPATVVSGLRCRQHNANVGGVANSQHMAGEACDLTVSGVSAFALLQFILTQLGVRYAYKINDNNVHFDIPKGG